VELQVKRFSLSRDTAIVVLDHSFRLNARVVSEASQSGLKLAFVYYSPFYHDPHLRSIYKDTRGNTELHEIAFKSFAMDIIELGGAVYQVSSGEPRKHLSELVRRNPRVASVYWDYPLFAPKWQPDAEDLAGQDVELIPVDSDSFDLSLDKRTAKSLVSAWASQRTPGFDFNRHVSFTDLVMHEGTKICVTVTVKTQHEIRDHLISSALTRVANRSVRYGETRNSYGGSCEVSCHMQHGILGAPSVIRDLLDNSTLDDVYPLIRQLAFRELAIKKARQTGLNMSSGLDAWISSHMSSKSAQHIRNVEFDPECSADELFAGKTHDEMLNVVIKRAKLDRWMPNRARMWFAGEAYHMLGGGVKSLQATLEFFDLFTDDGQSPNNYINCMSSLSLNYGRVVRLNRDKAIKLLNIEKTT